MGDSIAFSVNGAACNVAVHPMSRLLDVLREDLHLTGTKEGCGEGECGACSVLIDGVLTNSCLVPVLQVAGCRVTTIEGLRVGAIQRAFIDEGGAQCGICTPGMIMATVHLLERYPNADEQQIRDGLSGNLCRCTGYTRIFAAVRKAMAAR